MFDACLQYRSCQHPAAGLQPAVVGGLVQCAFPCPFWYDANCCVTLSLDSLEAIAIGHKDAREATPFKIHSECQKFSSLVLNTAIWFGTAFVLLRAMERAELEDRFITPLDKE